MTGSHGTVATAQIELLCPSSTTGVKCSVFIASSMDQTRAVWSNEPLRRRPFFESTYKAHTEIQKFSNQNRLTMDIIDNTVQPMPMKNSNGLLKARIIDDDRSIFSTSEKDPFVIRCLIKGGWVNCQIVRRRKRQCLSESIGAKQKYMIFKKRKKERKPTVQSTTSNFHHDQRTRLSQAILQQPSSHLACELRKFCRV